MSTQEFNQEMDRRVKELQEYFEKHESHCEMRPFFQPWRSLPDQVFFNIRSEIYSRAYSPPSDPMPEDIKDRCLMATYKVLEILARNLKTHIRTKPEVSVHRDFWNKTETAIGYVRFIITTEEGEWVFPETSGSENQVRYLPLPQLKT